MLGKNHHKAISIIYVVIMCYCKYIKQLKSYFATSLQKSFRKSELFKSGMQPFQKAYFSDSIPVTFWFETIIIYCLRLIHIKVIGLGSKVRVIGKYCCIGLGLMVWCIVFLFVL